MTRILRYAFLMIGLALAGEVASAQVPGGTPPFGSFGGGPDVIDLANLNSHIGVPVLHKAGRGLNFTYDLSYDNSVWYPVTSGSTTSWQPTYNWGWHGQTEIATGYISYYHYSVIDADGCTNMYWINWIYHDSWGVPHPFAGQAYAYFGPFNTQICTPAYFTGFTNTSGDGSGYTITVSGNSTGTNLGPVKLYARDGKSIAAPQNNPTGAATATDRNGNFVSADGSGHFYDTLSSSAAVLTVVAPSPPSSTTFTYAAPSGASATYTMNYTNYTVATNFGFGLSGPSEYKSSGPVPLVTSVVLPDGSQYSFQYEATPSMPASGACTPYTGTTCVTARIKSVTLPTGGTITYTYTGGHNGIFSDGSTSGLTRALSDGATWNATWTYARMQGTGAASTDTITDPLGDVTTMQFQGIYETQRVVNDVSLGLLETVNTCYNGSASPCTSTAVSTPISSQTVTTILPGSLNLQSKVATSYNSYGQLTEEDDYGYGSGAPGSLLRKKLITIQTVGTYQAIQTAQIQDGSGHVLAQTQMTFDEPPQPTTTSGTPQHQNPTVGRGNPTTISYLVGSTSLKKILTYFDTGNVQSIQDVNSATTTYTYSTDTTKTCGNSFPTGVTEPISGLTQSFVWNCTGGVATSSTDENTKTASTSYTDTQFWRPHSATDQLLNVTTLTYGGQTSAEGSMPFNGTNSTSDNLVTLDGLGRSHIVQTKQTPSSTSYDSVETDYDVAGRPYRTTTPYNASANQTTSPTAPATTMTYDALGRVLTVTDAGGGTLSDSYSQNDVYQTLGPVSANENTKRRQLEYDSLGRLTSVCEITSTLAGNGTCGQTNSQTGYWTKYTYDANGNLTGVTQNAQATSGQQTRSYSYDDLSRITSETNPESGVTSYTYDSLASDPNCGTVTYHGDLVKWTDAAGNTACSTFDLLHRNTSVTYHGTYASSTPNKNFVYDTATVNGVAMSNAKTRLAEAYTCFSPCSSKITDVGLSYTSRGEVSDEYESTPHSGGYYHVPATYWANGGPNQLNALPNGNPSLPGLPTFTFGADGEGRPNTVTAGSGQNPVTGTNYNPYNSPPQTTVNFGSGDSDLFNFDANTGRTTQYKFNVGSQPQSVVGALTWNANGTLQKLAITDPFNSSNAQTCNYAHDDLTRIASANCGSIWSQTFSFDAFGNINKSGNSSFSASYSPSTNRMTTIGSSSPTYDANGNVTNDFLHTYSWDAEGRPVTIDGIGATYDALGRMVELNRSGTYTEIAYTPTGGKLAFMSGQTLQKAFVPLPGGATAVYTSSGLDHYRHSDWLGSARLSTTPSRTVYGGVAYAPYGETYAASGNNDFSWTGINADVEPANPETLYDFPAREYGIQGRWPSPDPAGLGAVNPANPQSWNRYAYALNNPLALTDPTGLFGGEPGCDPGDPSCDPCAGNPSCGPCAWDPSLCLNPCLYSFFCGIEWPDPPTPEAPPAPPGGYGAGIDPFGNSFLPGEISGIPVSLICMFQPCILPDPSFKISVTVTGSLPQKIGHFFRGRPPGQGFGACVNENIRLLTFGKVDPSKLLSGGMLFAEAVGTAFMTTRVAQPNPMTGGTFFTTAATAAALGLRAFGVGSGAVVVVATAANAAGVTLAVLGAATAGALIGSAANCASTGVAQ